MCVTYNVEQVSSLKDCLFMACFTVLLVDQAVWC